MVMLSKGRLIVRTETLRLQRRRRLFLDTLNAADVDALADLAVRQGLAYNGFGFFPRDQQTSQALGALVKARGE